MTKISIIIPVLNEASNILKLIRKIEKNLKNITHEIIFVDDHSQDNSLFILKKAKKKYKNLNYIIRKKQRRDLTQSCILGIKKSKYFLNLIMDGDLQHNPKYICKMLNDFKKYDLDILIAARNFKTTSRNSLSFWRFFLSKTIILILSLLFSQKTSDPMAGYFLFKKSVVLKNEKELYGIGFKILADIIYNVKNLKTGDFFINFDSRNKGKSKMNFKIVMQIIYLIIFCLTKKIFKSPIRLS